ncbi:23S rRNA (uridine(2552)-2'-O)-methyltransferase RlmE [Blochmannia endosymbiont of Polyrhachis (Hedomyrma) turneri]|uniref:23S rRNA (uridine(2552)-2'-O)-methyltransferase RlmE n=1 Tax=Blochmannia endosymbiont of Polyrhachis (Hedomyrma) turneri TaxID=1505596 RepID=UPI00061A73F6|nr:23S rRNA (uridine(2552)-2'-O)-methyltransferase RlmE [Blochmannia endosymbiont of Polyrhachis (Hedomyrma) turneri]AKC59683.1 Ribosomal RNA large subunit methyltransferase E [Blochmannia endosymbiont of Polyrhachis (Hedomyrma) turneri]
MKKFKRFSHIRHSKWLQEHCNDQYVKRAKQIQVRSRAWFKLCEIDRIDSLFYPVMSVVDLGAAPGGWSQYVRRKLGQHGRIIACDILPMDRISGVYFLKGDICDSNMLYMLINLVNNEKVNIVLSDMSPNLSGIANIDVSKSIDLGEAALRVCKCILIFGGSFLVKIFQGEGFDEYLGNVCSLFHTVKIRKPDASNIRSREVYIVAKGYNKL